MAIGRGDRWIGRLAEQLPGPASGKDYRSGPDQRKPSPAVPDEYSAATSVMLKQIDREAVLPDAEVLPLLCALDDRAHDLSAGLVTQRVRDPGVRVASFAAQRHLPIDLIEMSAPLDQLADPVWGLVHHH